MCPKNEDVKLMAVSMSNLVDFQNSFTDALISKFVVQWLLQIPSQLKCVATLLCEIFFCLKMLCSSVTWANQQIILSSSKQLHKNIRPMISFACGVSWRYGYASLVYLSFPRSRSTWYRSCFCYNSGFLPHAVLQESSSSLRRTLQRCNELWDN